MTLRKASQIDQIIIHCSATPNGKAFTAADIDRWHRARDFRRDPRLINAEYPLKAIGYHFVIELDGKISRGRTIEEVGAHCKGYNTPSIGICLIGTDQFSLAQWQALKSLINELTMAYPRITNIKGHRDYSHDIDQDGKISADEFIKICPGFDVSAWLDNNMVPADPHRLNPAQMPFMSFVQVEQSKARPLNSEIPDSASSLQATDTIKPWWKSKTIWGILAAVSPTLSRMAGFDFELIQQTGADLLTILAALLAILGRFRATHSIK